MEHLVVYYFSSCTINRVSYLALNQNVKKANENTTPKMTVALVNEDQGTVFEGNKIAFGDQFVKNVNKNTKQEWYVVSQRGSRKWIEK